MKKFLSATLLVAMATASLSANMMMKPEEMVEVMNAMKGKTVEVPQELLRSWVQYKAKAFNMAAEAILDFAAQIKDSEIKGDFRDIADDYKELAKKLEEVEIPRQKLTKTFKNVDNWMKLKAEKAKLMAKKMKSIGEQLNNQVMLEKAKEVKQWAQTLSSSLGVKVSAEDKTEGNEDLYEDVEGAYDEGNGDYTVIRDEYEGADDETEGGSYEMDNEKPAVPGEIAGTEGNDEPDVNYDDNEGSDNDLVSEKDGIEGSDDDYQSEGAEEASNDDENEDLESDVTNDPELEGAEDPATEKESPGMEMGAA